MLFSYFEIVKSTQNLQPSKDKWNATRRSTGKGDRACFMDFIEYEQGLVWG